ncbi:NAD(P)H-dependent oxidoreductase [Arcanobacterium hippocoleae]|uniref:NAD(P)H-dependent oxidoreductase n=1 Tax=Arcanobacterium hippocoleae TaxID=149017 RepID=UPI00333FDEB4
MKIAAIWMGVSSESTTTKLTAQILKSISKHAQTLGVEIEFIEINLRDFAKQITLSILTPVPNAELTAAFESITTADAVITIAPIYKGAPIGIQTLFWQLIDDAALAGKPVLIGATGGTARHSLAIEYTMRPMLSYLKGIVLPSTIFAATDDWGSTTGASALQRRIESVASELLQAVVHPSPHATQESSANDTAALAAAVTPPERSNETIELFDQKAYAANKQSLAHHGKPANPFDPNSVTPFAQLLNRQ